MIELRNNNDEFVIFNIDGYSYPNISTFEANRDDIDKNWLKVSFKVFSKECNFNSGLKDIAHWELEALKDWLYKIATTIEVIHEIDFDDLGISFLCLKNNINNKAIKFTSYPTSGCLEYTEKGWIEQKSEILNTAIEFMYTKNNLFAIIKSIETILKKYPFIE